MHRKGISLSGLKCSLKPTFASNLLKAIQCFILLGISHGQLSVGMHALHVHHGAK